MKIKFQSIQQYYEKHHKYYITKLLLYMSLKKIKNYFQWKLSSIAHCTRNYLIKLMVNLSCM